MFANYGVLYAVELLSVILQVFYCIPSTDVARDRRAKSGIALTQNRYTL